MLNRQNPAVEAISVDVPAEVALSRNKSWILNLNNYRNAHYQTLNKAKVNFKNLLLSKLQQLPVFTRIDSIEYVLYRNTKRRCDVANVCSIVDKFFCDALVEAGKLPDDNWHYLNSVTYRWGGVEEQGDSHIIINITGRTDMNIFNEVKIDLDSADILSAVKKYLTETYPQFAEEIKSSDFKVEKEDENVAAHIRFAVSPEKLKSAAAKQNSEDGNTGGKSGSRRKLSAKERLHEELFANATINVDAIKHPPVPNLESESADTTPMSSVSTDESSVSDNKGESDESISSDSNTGAPVFKTQAEAIAFMERRNAEVEAKRAEEAKHHTTTFAAFKAQNSAEGRAIRDSRANDERGSEAVRDVAASGERREGQPGKFTNLKSDFRKDANERAEFSAANAQKLTEPKEPVNKTPVEQELEAVKSESEESKPFEGLTIFGRKKVV